MASYPSYDQNSYPEIVSDLLQDETSPLLNRATQGIFPPGSTFKPLTAAAALTKGVITADTEITCEGVFTAFEDYQPACWLWNSFRMTHGPINVTTALAVSCNYFFYQIGKDTGITYLDEYALEYGFGVETGIEIGEQTGVLAGPESRRGKRLPLEPRRRHSGGYRSVRPRFYAASACLLYGYSRKRRHTLQDTPSPVGA